MKRHCQPCGTRLGLWQTRCPYCRRPAVSWLHRVIIAASAVVAVFIYLLKSF